MDSFLFIFVISFSVFSSAMGPSATSRGSCQWCSKLRDPQLAIDFKVEDNFSASDLEGIHESLSLFSRQEVVPLIDKYCQGMFSVGELKYGRGKESPVQGGRFFARVVLPMELTSQEEDRSFARQCFDTVIEEITSREEILGNPNFKIDLI